MEAITAPKMVPGYRHAGATTVARPRFATCSPSTAPRSPRRWRSGSAPGSASITWRSTRAPVRWFTNGRAARLEEKFVELTGAPIRLKPSPSPRRGGCGSGRRRRRDVPRSCSPTSTTWTTTGARRTSPVTPWSWRATTRPSRTSPTRRSRSSRRRVSRTCAGAPRKTAGHAARRSHVHGAGGEGDRATSVGRRRLRSSATRGRDDRSAAWVSTKACRRCDRFAAEVGDWPEQIEDWQWCARFGYQVIERRGTGGGNFRLMYSTLPRGGGREEARLAADAASRWTTLAEHLQVASESRRPRTGDLGRGSVRRPPRSWTRKSAFGRRSPAEAPGLQAPKRAK